MSRSGGSKLPPDRRQPRQRAGHLAATSCRIGTAGIPAPVKNRGYPKMENTLKGKNILIVQGSLLAGSEFRDTLVRVGASARGPNLCVAAGEGFSPFGRGRVDISRRALRSDRSVC